MAYVNGITVAVIGGEKNTGNSPDTLSEMSFLNLDSLEWSTVNPMKTRRSSPACGVIEGIIAYVQGKVNNWLLVFKNRSMDKIVHVHADVSSDKQVSSNF